MKPTKNFAFVTLFVAFGALACHGEGPVPFGPATTADDEPMSSRATTQGDVALENLGSQIHSLEEIVERQPGWLDARSQLVGLLLARTQFAGSYSDFERVDRLTRDGMLMESRSAPALRLRATYLSSVHRFDEALALLDEAQLLDGKPATEARRTMALARGDLDVEALIELESAVERTPSFAAQTSLASHRAAAGDYQGAALMYRRSLESYRDVSPFPVAWVHFQLGVMWAEEANESMRAMALYAEAVHRVPGYVVARVHGAELLWRAGEVDAAIAQLEEIVEQTEDPEPMGLLGEILLAEGRSSARAESLIGEARRRYERLLDAHREAFLDHASEFFAGPGKDPARALRLALENLELRRNARAYRVALEAASAAHDRARRCALIVEAEDAELASKTLNALLEIYRPGC